MEALVKSYEQKIARGLVGYLWGFSWAGGWEIICRVEQKKASWEAARSAKAKSIDFATNTEWFSTQVGGIRRQVRYCGIAVYQEENASVPRGCEMSSRIIHYGMHVELAADAARSPALPSTQYVLRRSCLLACARARAPGSCAPSKSPLSEKTNSGRCAMRPSAGLTGGLGVPCCAPA